MILWSVWVKYLSCLYENKPIKQDVCHTILYVIYAHFTLCYYALNMQISLNIHVLQKHYRTKDGLFSLYGHKEPFKSDFKYSGV